MKWQTKEGLLRLLEQLVGIESVTGSSAEIKLAQFIAGELSQLSYFQENPDHIQLHPTKDGRYIVTGLVKRKEHAKTVVLVSHFDVVNVEDYGKWKHLAFRPKELTEMFYHNKHLLPIEVQHDLAHGEWLFGRGTMDMKCGLASQMAMIEQATTGAFEGNILLLAVCDEEVNSIGMITAVPVLLKLAKQHNLKYTACLNSEPMFARYPGDETKYIYTGSIGKVLPGFYCYGKESHVGEPLAGLNANIMTSFLTCELELNTNFCEVIEGEVSPPPTCLQQKDLKQEYSVQTPHCSVALYNMLIMEKSIQTIVEELREAAKKAAVKVEDAYNKEAVRFANLQQSVPNKFKVKVMTFEELKEYAIQTYGDEALKKIEMEAIKPKIEQEDERDITIRLVDGYAALCSELAPMIVLFFAPPYYPSVSSRKHPMISRVTEDIINYAWEIHGTALKKQMYFGGLSDLSYTGLQQPLSSLELFISNTPLWEKGYALPFEELQQLDLPVLNVGPMGKDAHKWTERLDVAYATGPLQDILKVTIQNLLQG
ncbi:M20/M25/M40 family metallo-hydrolase [Bacillus sp. 165]|nr:M20/M25/M40 family metallo-hydrolase [Bacillus sp. 165]